MQLEAYNPDHKIKKKSVVWKNFNQAFIWKNMNKEKWNPIINYQELSVLYFIYDKTIAFFVSHTCVSTNTRYMIFMAWAA